MTGNKTSASDNGATLNYNAGGECGENGRRYIASESGTQGHVINKLKCILTDLTVGKFQKALLTYCSHKTRSNYCPH